MKDIQNNKSIKVIACFSLAIGVIAIIVSFLMDKGDVNYVKNHKTIVQIAGLLLALAVILFVLQFQIKRRLKNKKNRYHAVHWDNGKITKDE
ncbi:MAG: hypothetical protein MJZ60_07015 [Bacteroidaceae bacterium]|nr:hypothetical protein [Bacteroidaceae bacterium]